MLLFAVSGAVLLVAVLIISYPLVFGTMEGHSAPPPPGSEYSERDALLEAMGDLETAFQTGKLTTADYEQQKAVLEREYVKVLEGAGGPS